MKLVGVIIPFLILSANVRAQNLIVEEGVGIGRLKLGQSLEEVINVLGFQGELKSYDDYLAEELFNEDPEIALECAIGFDYYIKFEHLITLPVSYVFFKDNSISQIKISSFPEYFFAIARDTRTKNGLNFWSQGSEITEIYGSPDLQVNYDNFILDSYFYFDRGITFNLREDNYRSAHIYSKLNSDIVDKFTNEF
ncbi:MAG: hypothetical protein MI975_05120 [Cytophagales bacterium]|nr:hypothetical protein [Cytophagales bacterium]